MKILKDDGFILVHDCLPRSIAHQAIPRYRGSWNGDVWKSIVEIRANPHLDTFTCKIDFGVGVIRLRNNTDLLHIQNNDFRNLKFADYYNNHQKFMRVVEYNDLLNII